MKLSTNMIIQVLALAAQAINAVSGLLPPSGKFWAMVALSTIQGISGIVAHFSNPDGTPASQPFVKQ